MAVNEQYRRQVALLVQVLPFIAEESCFALKGGTAINLFIRDMPRLSVDIDLTYLPVADRTSSLSDIDAALRRIARRTTEGLRGSRVHEGELHGEQTVNKLVVYRQGVHTKVEVTPVLRGCVYEPEMRTVSPRVEENFGFAEVQVVSFGDLYAGKIVAALDRQHPRDLFDVRDLMSHEGIDDNLRRAFIVYLLSHNRPIAELLAPVRRDITHEFERGFIGMTETPVAVNELFTVREQLITEVVGKMPRSHRDLLLSFKRGEPDWALLGIAGIEKLPAVRWRLKNLARLSEARRNQLLEALQQVLGVTAS